MSKTKPKQQRLANDDFLISLTTLLQATTTSNHGSIFLTQKPLPSNPSSVLLRATNGYSTTKANSKPGLNLTDAQKHSVKPKIKIATVVDAADLEGFYARYAEVCKRGMEGLRKRDKRKGREKAKAKKKKVGTS